MDKTAEGHNRSASQSSPLASPSGSSTQTWLPVESPPWPPWRTGCRMEQDGGMRQSPPSRVFEERSCTSQTSHPPVPLARLVPLVPLAGAFVPSSGSQADVVKQGYLGKMERKHRRYFMLRAGSHTGPSRLEWYKSQEKFTSLEKSAGKATLFGSSKQGVIYLRCCLGVSRFSSLRKGHMVALYAKDQTMVLVVEDQWEQDEWYLAIKKVMEKALKEEQHGGGFTEEDDGYCTLPPAVFLKEVKPRGLACSKSLAGDSRLCLTDTSLILVKVGACSDLPLAPIPLLSIRRYGHLDDSFFLELGRSAPIGPGEVWMEARDQGNQPVAQRIHEVVRDTMRELRVLPDFSRSPNAYHNQLHTLPAAAHCRPKTRDEQVSASSLSSCPAPTHRHPEIQTGQTQSSLEPCNPDQTEPGSESNIYMEMKSLPVSRGKENGCRRVAMVPGDRCSVAVLEPSEKKEEGGRGYMMMSPQVSHSSSVLPQDDYMAMASPPHDSPAYSSLQTSFNSSCSDSYSPLHPSHDQTGLSHWLMSPVQQSETEAGQSQMSISHSTQTQDDGEQEPKSVEQSRLPPQTRTTSSPVRSTAGFGLMTPLVPIEPGYISPVQASPNSGLGQCGPGEIGMEARDQGNQPVAQHTHEVARDTMRELRVLPDLSWSTNSDHNQLHTLLAPAHCRPKSGDNPRPLSSCLTPTPRHPEIQTGLTQSSFEPHKPDQTEPGSAQSTASQDNIYMEMKSLPVSRGKENYCKRVAMVPGDRCSVAVLELSEKKEEGGRGYMMMSPQVSHSSSVLLQDDYTAMASPPHDRPAYSSLQTSFNSSCSDSYSPLHPSHHPISLSHWLMSPVQQSETEAGQSQRISCSTRAQDDGEQAPKSAKLPPQTSATASPVRSTDGSGLMTPLVAIGPGYIRRVQASPSSGPAASERPVRRRLLSLCLPSCLQPKDRS